MSDPAPNVSETNSPAVSIQSSVTDEMSISLEQQEKPTVNKNGTSCPDNNYCVLHEGKLCICDICESNREILLKNKKRKLSSPSQKEDKKAYCQPASIRETEEEKLEKMTRACRTILTSIGEQPDREGLLKTPARWAKALLFMTKGYKQNVHDVTNDAVFSEDSHKEMVIVKDIDVHSLCEHHMLPFTGRLHVGYIPNGKIIGLSKMARIAEVFSRRLQVQERLTAQIADAVVEAVDPLGVAVVIESSHFCMVMRGVQKCGAKTITSAVRGCFESNSKTRSEFFSIIHQK